MVSKEYLFIKDHAVTSYLLYKWKPNDQAALNTEHIQVGAS